LNARKPVERLQKGNHHARIERRLAQPTDVAAHDRLEIQALPHQPNDKPRDVVLGHEVPHIRRQKQRLIDIPGAKVLAHSPSLNQTRCNHQCGGLAGFARILEGALGVTARSRGIAK
jgi:hypothetical protein